MRHARFSCFCRYIAIDLYKHVIICSLTEAIVGWRDRFNEVCSFFNKSIVYTSQLAMEMEATARVLKLLGDPTRLTILAILHKRECCVCERLVVFSTSQHLRKLADPSGAERAMGVVFAPPAKRILLAVASGVVVRSGPRRNHSQNRDSESRGPLRVLIFGSEVNDGGWL